jgi:hypothetical protein
LDIRSLFSVNAKHQPAAQDLHIIFAFQIQQAKLFIFVFLQLRSIITARREKNKHGKFSLQRLAAFLA